MKSPSDELFQLVKSLNGQEKRYFKIFASRHTIGEKNNYLKLYDAIDSQNEYDEREIKRMLKGEKFLNQFFVLKKYLYDMILKGLNAYHAQSSVDQRISMLIHFIEILYNKGLYGQCLKSIEKAEKIARKYEHHPALLEITHWKFRILCTSDPKRNFESQLDLLHEQEENLIGQILNYYQFRWLNSKLFSKAMKMGWFPRTAEEIELEYKPIVTNSIFTNENIEVSYRSRILFFNTFSVFYHLSGDARKSYIYSQKAKNIFLKRPKLIESCMEDYVSCLSNLAFTSMFLGKYSETLHSIGTLKQINAPSKALRARIFISSHLPEIILYNITGNLNAGINLISEIDALIKGYEKYISKRDVMYLQYNISCLCFKSGKYKQAAQVIFQMLNNPEIKPLSDLHIKVRILNLMVQTELCNTDLLPFIVRSTHRFLVRQQHLYQFEKKVLDFLSKYPDLTSSEIIPVFKKLRDDLTELSKYPYEKKAMDFLGFINWIDTKITLSK